ncbi:hypothetical protein PCANC_07943 [Puccinia coronata f. sp. avenae]|uniref:Uncharacterized protein n=1 Tax=Puccinia coronata f. sp. avenae TaxID=200324 RepID=A0A2N5SX67_9BASI|nr:hypothetical protein PCANC_15024 [Puccinia coronata f. sp. avenae]PLW17812.1 hypothetical protein PCANC_11979 [Puccinia coronata f. sp. avenae]PLW24126.1 hypothetical protein PCASD_06694 [Puccinia coronata f. sp. avenae]PLW29721.1 hypothetical protein PCASD_15586 [Puccinia coronata f. sp. avenae]PLW42813.1 hypothetical protein PCANC_07943 [Puccinia coronata f. sp. avenae]
MVQTPASNRITHHPVSRLLPLLPRRCHHSPSRFLFRPQPSAHHITAHHHSPVAHLSLTPSQHSTLQHSKDYKSRPSALICSKNKQSNPLLKQNSSTQNSELQVLFIIY